MLPDVPRVDVVFRGGSIWSPEDDRPQSDSALAVAAGTIVATGREAQELADQAVEVVEIGDGLLAPAFRDGHQHPLLGGLQPRYARVSEATSVEEVVQAVAQWARDHPDEAWVRGLGYAPALSPDAEFDARWLDAAVADRPVALNASDFHTMWVNSKALELAGIDASTPQPGDGIVIKRDDGSPMGTLRDWDAWRRVQAVMPPVPLDDRVDAALDAGRRLASMGIVAVQDAWVEEVDMETWLAVLARCGDKLFDVRVDLATLLDPGSWREAIRRAVDAREHLERNGRGWLTARAVKLFADGVIEEKTAALLEPYDGSDSWRGMPRWDDDELADAAVAADEAGLQIHVHAIGDAAVRSSLDALAEVLRRNGERHRRHVVAHSQLLAPEDLGRYAELGVIANVEPAWCQLEPGQTGVTLPVLGTERGNRQYPLRSLHASGARLACGSDWPVSSPVPMEGIGTAVTRRTAQGEPAGGWMPEERLDLVTIMRAYTAGSAYQAFEPGEAALRPGAPADLVLLDADPWTLASDDIATVGVRGTWRGGVRTFDAD